MKNKKEILRYGTKNLRGATHIVALATSFSAFWQVALLLLSQGTRKAEALYAFRRLAPTADSLGAKHIKFFPHRSLETVYFIF